MHSLIVNISLESFQPFKHFGYKAALVLNTLKLVGRVHFLGSIFSEHK